MIWWYGDMVTSTTEKYFTNEIVENTLHKEKEYWKKTMVKKHWHAEKQNQTF